MTIKKSCIFRVTIKKSCIFRKKNDRIITENHDRYIETKINHRRELNSRPPPGIELATSGQTRVKIIMSVLAILGQNSHFRSKFSKKIDNFTLLRKKL